ncbi:uncharacterized protein LOC144653789 [Oculina patagonica]
MAIQLQILLVDFSTTFREVKHDVNDNSRLPNNAASQNIVRNFCRSPVPDYYRINLQESANEVQIIKGKPNTPCPKYDGGSNSIPAPGNVLSCNGAENPTVRLFGVKSMAEDFYKEERSRACYNLKQDCDKCRNDCTVRARANPICNLTKSDVDADSKQEYGEHFTYCFDCCFEEDCICPSCACTQYNSSCINSSVTCVGAKHFTIPITPVFPNTGLFKCHVELSKGPVFELETSLWKNGKLLKRIEKNQRNYSKEFESGTTSYDYGYMILKHPSVLRSNMRKTIMISGKAGESNFDVGWYMTEKELESPNPATTLSIQPTHPFKINTKDWPRENCLTLDTEKFVIISPGVSIDNVKNLAQLTAKVANEQNARVYKVYNTSGSHQVHFEVPPERSVLRYAFPETVIFNDRSFTGKLLKNRTFWTIRLTGQASSCPGFFMVRLTDQDRPDVDVYHYDIAITNQECSFRVEFHLPSGGDTNMIDKQFVVRLTDSRKTMKLILVSPRRIPEFEIPDIDDDFDLKKLEVLIPFGGAAGGMFIVLIAILIYGYKTRPKDSYHRDRDNELHFRHVLFVVWFVGMRLVKSFLLTLTVLFVILTAIHYTNVKTLEKYETFHKQRKQLEEDFIQQMDTHKVQEINRQWSLLGEGKVVCDQKLKELNVFLERHFKEMRARQLEEMRRKSIILAAEHRIKKQFNETRAKFERERKRLNDQMEAYSNEINSRISRIERKIEGSFWLKAAKVLYKILDALASIFGSGIGKPFIAWVGLSVDFPSIDANLPSFDDIFSDFSSFSLVPHNGEENSNSSIWRGNSLTDIKIHIQQISVPDLNISRPLTKEKAEELLALEWIVQLYRSGVFTTILVILDVLWFVYRHSKTYQLAVVLIHGFPRVYELEKIQKKEEEKEEKKKKKEEKLKKKEEKKARKKKDKFEDEDHEEANKKQDENYEGSEEKNMEDAKEISRHKDDTKCRAKAKPTDETDVALGKTIPKISVESEKKITENQDIKRVEASGDETKSEESKSRKVIGHGLKGLDRLNAAFLKFVIKLKELNYQINNTNLVPMCVLTVIGILSVYVVIVTAKHTMTVETLDVVGYFDLKMAPLLTMRKIVNTRITSNAFMVNDVHIPYYENRVNARIAFYRRKAKMYQAYQCSKADLHNEEYCSWVEEPGTSCEGVGPYNKDFLSNLTQFECNLEPVIPQRFTKFDRIRYKEVHKKAIAPYVAALRGLILDTFYMLLIVIGIFIIFRILGIVVFLFLKKLDLVRQVKHYQTSQDLKKELTLPHCIKYQSNQESIVRRVGPLQMSEDMKEKFGDNIHEGKAIQWVK